MKIGVVGCGAVGSFYGAKLQRAGHEVHFLLRSDDEAVRRDGVRILSPEGDFQVRPIPAGQPAGVGCCDLVLVALKTTANHAFSRLLPPLVGPNTWVLTLQNGLGNEEQLAALLGPQRILGGLCFVCLNRIAPGVIQHLAHGDIVLGRHQREPTEVVNDLAAEFARAGIACRVTGDLAQAHWEKLVWNIPFNGLGVAGVAGYEAVVSGAVPDGLESTRTLATDELLGDARWAGLVSESMREVVASGRALGFPIALGLPDAMIARTLCMGPYRASTLLDFERGAPLELDSLFREPLRRASAGGVATPRLRALCSVLVELDRRNAARRQ